MEKKLLQDIREIFGLAAIGDFSKDLPLEDYTEEQSLEIGTGIQIMLDVIRWSVKQIETKSENALAGAENRFRTLVNSSIDGIVISNDQGEIIDVNKAVTKIFGYSLQELIKAPISILMPEKYRNLHQKAFDLHLKTGIAHLMDDLIELEGKRNDGTEFPIELTLSHWTSHDKTYYGAVIRDISRRKGLIQSLEKEKNNLQLAVLELEQFAYAASHDLREPLRGINSYAQLLQKKYSNQLDETACEYLDIISKESVKMYNATGSLLQLASIRREVFTPSECAVNEIMEKAHSALHDGAYLQLILPESDVHIMADRSMLFDLFYSLLDNSVKFNAGLHDLVVVISIEQVQDSWELRVQDNGCGVSNEYHERIFLPFRKLTTKDNVAGSGLGLSIARRIMDIHSGDIHVCNAQGGGLCVCLSFPV